MTTAVIYAAKSTADERGSLESQTTACREHCERNGWDVAGEYKDEAKSGYSGSRGDDLIAAKEHAARLAPGGDVVLLVFASDRLARGDGTTKAAHLVEHVLDARKAGYRVEAVTEDIGGEMAIASRRSTGSGPARTARRSRLTSGAVSTSSGGRAGTWDREHRSGTPSSASGRRAGSCRIRPPRRGT